MNFNFIELFTRAAKINLKYKIVWIFGLLTAYIQSVWTFTHLCGMPNHR